MSGSEDAAMKPDNDCPNNRPGRELPRDLKSIEARLAALSPRDDRLDRERLMFLAGQASVEPTYSQPRTRGKSRRSLRGWQKAFACMTVVAATLLAILATRPAMVEPPSPRTRNVATISLPPAASLPGNNHGAPLSNYILLTAHARHPNIEQLIVREPQSLDASVPTGPHLDDRDRDHLTPAAWWQVFKNSG